MAKKNQTSTEKQKAKEQLNQLRKRHLSYFQKKLKSDSMYSELSKIIDHYRNWLLSQQVGDFVDTDVLKSILKLLLDGAFLEELLENIVKPYIISELNRIREDNEEIDYYFDERSLKLLRDVISNPDLLPKEWLEKTLDHEAFHQLMASLLYNALKEFTIQVNPFFSSWGLPALLKKAAPFGGIFDPFGVGNKVIDTLKTEFEKQLEPQIKNFLTFFTGTAIQHAYSFATGKENKKIFIELRQDMLTNILAEKTSIFTSSLTPKAIEQFAELSSSMTLQYLRRKSTRKLIKERIDSFFDERNEQTFGEIFAKYNIDTYSWSRELLNLIRPILRTYLQSKEFSLIIELMVNDFYDQELEKLQK